MRKVLFYLSLALFYIPVVIPADGAFLTIIDYSPRFAPVNRETSLSFTLKNVGNDPTEGETNMVLSCENEGIQFVNGETTFGIVGGNGLGKCRESGSSKRQDCTTT